jgi:SH3-like domain-containing protein
MAGLAMMANRKSAARRQRMALIIPLLLASTCPPASAVEVGRTTGLQLPRFVSVKADRANVRVGPGTDYAVKFTLVRHGLPLEITAEFENWRRVRDWNGDEGWMLAALLSGKRMGLVRPWSSAEPLPLYASPSTLAPQEAIMQPKVMVAIDECDGTWCEVRVRGEIGYVEQAKLWGAYPGETFR